VPEIDDQPVGIFNDRECRHKGNSIPLINPGGNWIQVERMIKITPVFQGDHKAGIVIVKRDNRVNETTNPDGNIIFQ